MLLTWVLMSLAHAECTEDSYSRMLHAASRAEYAFASLDEPALVAAATDLRGAIPCVQSPISAPDAALIHRATAFIAFFEHHDDQARQAWASARALQPAWEPSETLLPPGHALHTLWVESAKLETGSIGAPYAAPGGWAVDGLAAQEFPTGRPFVLQGLAADGSVASTRYQWTPELPRSAAIGLSEEPDPEADKPGVRIMALAGLWTASAFQEASPEGAPAVEASGAGGGASVAVFVRPAPILMVDAGASLGFASAEFVGSPLDYSAGTGLAVGPVFGSKLAFSPQARVGVSVERVGAWTASSDAATAGTMPGLDLGVQAVLESPRAWALVGATHTLGAARLPFRTEVGTDMQFSLVGPVALAVHAGWSTSGLVLENADGERVARRRESGLTASAGIGLAL